MTHTNNSSQPTWPKDDQAKGAIAILNALNDAEAAFNDFGYKLSLQYQSIKWRNVHNSSNGGYKTLVGVSFTVNEKEHLLAEVCVSVSMRDKGFVVEGWAAVDNPDPKLGQRFLRDFDDVTTTNLDECIAALRRYTDELCTYTTLLNELGVPRTTTS